MNTELYSKCLIYDFKSLFNKKGYSFFTKGIYNLNIIGVRSNKGNKVTNKFDDILIVDYNTKTGHKRQIYSITTEPGLSSMLNPVNGKGTAILVPGQYKGAYCIALHNNKYKALCQRLKPVKVYRDGNRDKVYDLLPESIEEGNFGINIHRANESYIRSTVDSYSAGCQVFDSPKEFKSFINLLEESRKIFGNCFTYTLIDEKEIV